MAPCLPGACLCSAVRKSMKKVSVIAASSLCSISTAMYCVDSVALFWAVVLKKRERGGIAM